VNLTVRRSTQPGREKLFQNILHKEEKVYKAHETPSPSFVSDINANSAPSVLFLHSPSAVVLLQATFVYADFSRMKINVCEDPLRHKRTQRRFPLQIKTTKLEIVTLILLRTYCSAVPISGFKRKICSHCIPVYIREAEVRVKL
jgi:hypothetical protein